MASAGKEPLSLEEQVKILRQQLSEAQKLTALGELLGTTTHEFNNVLTTILNYAKMGLRYTDEPTRTKSFDKILAAAQRAAKITTGVLSLARNRSGSFEPTSLSQIVEDTLVLLERELTKHKVHVEQQLADVPQVWANGNQIQQVLMNIVINARQAMSNGGRLILSLHHDSGGEWVDLVIRDTGCGMSNEVMRRIFDRFYTTKSGPDSTGKGGTGLGLSACLDIIESHKGKIRVESAPGRGTQFTIRLPVAPTQPVIPPTVTLGIPHMSDTRASVPG